MPYIVGDAIDFEYVELKRYAAPADECAEYFVIDAQGTLFLCRELAKTETVNMNWRKQLAYRRDEAQPAGEETPCYVCGQMSSMEQCDLIVNSYRRNYAAALAQKGGTV